MRVTPAYISIGANRSSSCSARSRTGTIAFGAGTFVALWNPDVSNHFSLKRLRLIYPKRNGGDRGVYATLPGHKGQVTSVKLLSDANAGPVFISGDAAGEVRLWEPGRQDTVRKGILQKRRADDHLPTDLYHKL